MNSIANPQTRLESAGAALVSALSAPEVEPYLRTNAGQRWLGDLMGQIREADPVWLDGIEEMAAAELERHCPASGLQAWEV